MYSIIAQISGAIVTIIPAGFIIKKIYCIGFPAIIVQVLMSVMTYLLNVILVGLGEKVVTAYGFSKLVLSGSPIWVVWLTFPIAEILSAMISLIFIKKWRERKSKP